MGRMFTSTRSTRRRAATSECPRFACGGGKGGGSSYDPQMGAASARAAETADRAERFSEDYYTNVITPLLRDSTRASNEAQTKLGKLYDINATQTQQANDRYNQYGVPAEDSYYKMAGEYSEPEEFERQAQAAKGDLGAAAGAQQGGMLRQFASLGIDPSSPAATAAMSDIAVQNAASEAGAMNRARSAARTLGMQLKSDAANFGRGGQSGILQFGAGAQGNATGAFGVANQNLNTASTAANGVMSGYQTALSGFNNNTNAYASMGAADIKARSESGSGFGQLLGAVAGSAMGGAKPWFLGK